MASVVSSLCEIFCTENKYLAIFFSKIVKFFKKIVKFFKVSVKVFKVSVKFFKAEDH